MTSRESAVGLEVLNIVGSDARVPPCTALTLRRLPCRAAALLILFLVAQCVFMCVSVLVFVQLTTGDPIRQWNLCDSLSEVLDTKLVLLIVYVLFFVCGFCYTAT